MTECCSRCFEHVESGGHIQTVSWRGQWSYSITICDSCWRKRQPPQQLTLWSDI